jgi:hypothetical protein
VRAFPTAAIVQPLGAEVQGRWIAGDLPALERGRRTGAPRTRTAEPRRPVPARAVATSGRVAA